jgi:shikimate dehydrogenase
MPGLQALLLGHPVSHSLSPLLQNAAFSWAGFDARYAVLDVPEDELESVLSRLESDPEVVGCNVTVPHKGGVYRWLSENGRNLWPSARVFEAVNTLWRDAEGRWQGDSTDFDGFLHNLRKNIRIGGQAFPDEASFGNWLANVDVAILGAGGSARTVARGLALGREHRPRSLHVFARSPEKAAGLAEPANVHSLGEFRDWNRGRRSLVVQTTTLGMESGSGAGLSPVPEDAMGLGQVACDIVYKPLETPFLAHARARGALGVTGIGMLVGQGAVSCRKWLAGAGIAKDIFPLMDTMEKALSEVRA